MVKQEIDEIFSKEYGKICNIIKKYMKYTDGWETLIGQSYIHLINYAEDIKNKSDFYNYLIGYSTKQWWDGSDFLYEKGQFQKYLKWREMDVLDCGLFSEVIEYEEIEYSDKLDKEVEALELKLKSLTYEYKILFTLIFKDGIVSNKELSKHLEMTEANVIQLKKNLKNRLNVQNKKHWRKKEIKNIWENL